MFFRRTKAVKKCTTFYSPMMTTADEDFNDILAKFMEFNLLENSRYRSGDIGYGRLFADMYKEIARYLPERKKLFVYDGKRWVPDIANLKIIKLCTRPASKSKISARASKDLTYI
ncbi:hypothetical protein [Peptoniphilus duerdenii]|uniref:hypothetical protein n=1 Tax=Peptoniphilus duerdenii TaxID=507750 RepID=UPI00288A2742|nr:hypothetical protein [Peptoniphilus duerdenii]